MFNYATLLDVPELFPISNKLHTHTYPQAVNVLFAREMINDFLEPSECNSAIKDSDFYLTASSEIKLFESSRQQQRNSEQQLNSLKMDASQVRCSTCSKYFNNNDIVYVSTKCGHVYHQKCLFDKFNQQSRLCGGSRQCSSICYPRHCRRVYLTFNSFSWVYIEPKVFQANERDFDGTVLKLGTNNKGHNIYAARVFLQDKAIPCYYNAQQKRAYQNFECTLDEFSGHWELLDISNDAGHQYTWMDCDKVPSSRGYFRENKILIRKSKAEEQKLD